MMLSAMAFMRPGLGELLVIALVAALLIGTKRLPDLARSLGVAIRNFRRSLRDDDVAPPSSDKGA